MTDMAGDAPKGDAARLTIAPEPSARELAAIVAVLRSREANRVPVASGAAMTPEQCRWKMVARREAVFGGRADGLMRRTAGSGWEH